MVARRPGIAAVLEGQAMTADKLIVILGLVAAIGRAYGPDVLAVIKYLQTRKAAK